MKKFTINLIFSLALFLPFSTYAWNQLAHMTIATIAYQHLNASTLTKVNTLVQAFSQEYSDMNSFVAMSYWADQERMTYGVTAYNRWHYYLHGFSTDGTPVLNTIANDSGAKIMSVAENTIKLTSVNQFDRARFMAFAINIAGDMHQPLYTSNLFSSAFPNGTNGGTNYLINYNGASVDLQSFWDSGLGLFNAAPTTQNAAAHAATITALYPPSYFGSKVSDMSAGDWANEGYKDAQQFVYTVAANSTPSAAYIQTGQQMAQQRIALAGYRLANYLNTLLP